MKGRGAEEEKQRERECKDANKSEGEIMKARRNSGTFL